jgi:hypothetical protein
MRVSSVLITLTTLTVLTLGATRDASACSCERPGPPCQDAFRADAAFAGTVTNISELPDDRPPLPPGQGRLARGFRVEFEDVVPFRGVQGRVVNVVTAGSGPECGYAFSRGQRYLVYASRSRDGAQLVASICSRTRPIANASEDLAFLQTLSTPSTTGARLYGTVTHWERDLATKQGREYGPVQDVMISARSAANAFDVLTDSQGRYELMLPPGKYEVTALPPTGFSTRYLQRSVELHEARSCFLAEFAVRFDGRVKGAIRQSSNEPAEGISVELMARDRVGDAGNVETLRTSTDASGNFEFVEVPPGQYVVGVDLTKSISPTVVFPTTFHPGTPDSTRATVVQLSGAEQFELEPMTLPLARQTHRLTGIVVFDDGTPAVDINVSLQDGSSTWRQVGGTRTQSDGAFSMVVHEGLSYTARASYWDEAKRTQLLGSVGPFIVARDVGPLKLVLSRGK